MKYNRCPRGIIEETRGTRWEDPSSTRTLVGCMDEGQDVGGSGGDFKYLCYAGLSEKERIRDSRRAKMLRGILHFGHLNYLSSVSSDQGEPVNRERLVPEGLPG